jgi:hypothetical protein
MCVILRFLRICRTCFSCCRLKIKHNIGIVFVKMGQFSDACSKFEDIMQEKPDYASGNITIVAYVFHNKCVQFWQLLSSVTICLVLLGNGLCL